MLYKKLAALLAISLSVVAALAAPAGASAQASCAQPAGPDITSQSTVLSTAPESFAAGPGLDAIHALDGNDCVFGGDHADWLHGGAGNDVLNGNSHADTLNGGDGVDLLAGDVSTQFVKPLKQEGAKKPLPQNIDLLAGGDGDDTLIGGWDVDEYYPGDGVDTCVIWDEGGNSLAKELARTHKCETIVKKAAPKKPKKGYKPPNPSDPPSFPSSEPMLDCPAGVPVETATGTAANDYLYSQPAGQWLRGAEGWDRLDLNSGDDCADGGPGIDVVFGGKGTDQLVGGLGTTPEGDYIYGGEGVDVIDGQDGDDFLYGGGGNDSLIGGLGTDVCFGQAGKADSIAADCEFVFKD